MHEIEQLPGGVGIADASSAARIQDAAMNLLGSGASLPGLFNFSRTMFDYLDGGFDTPGGKPAAEEKADPWEKLFGDFLQSLTGINSANAFNAEQAQLDREYQTSERLAAQEYNSAEALAAWQRSEISAQRARDFELEADSTRYQRTMADAAAAGINPMMVATSGIGAGTLSGQAASSSAASVSPQSGSRAAASGNSASVIAAIVSTLGKLATSLIPKIG